MRAFILSLLLSQVAQAATMPVSYVDSDAFSFTGYVDTESDSLTIETWVESPGGSSWRDPRELPMIWPAKKVTYVQQFTDGPHQAWPYCRVVPYDVPDDWSPAFTGDLLFESGLVSANPDVTGGWGIGHWNDQGCQLYGGGDALVWSRQVEVDGPFRMAISQPDSWSIGAVPTPEPSGVLLFGLFVPWTWHRLRSANRSTLRL